MKNWRMSTFQELHRQRDMKLEEMRKTKLELEKLNSEVNIIETQILCHHEMEEYLPAGSFGEVVVEKCVKCGYEWSY